jgi:hypothetical protein
MKIRIRVQDGPKAYDFEHGGPAICLGRNPAGDVVFEEEAVESVVSWEHARIDLSPREATLTDLRSTNGTYRNGTPVSGTVPLWPNDAVRLGQTGPTLTVKAIDLAPPAAVSRPTPPRPAMIPVDVPVKAVKPRAARVAAPVMSETRGIALQAVQDLMAQQEELRAQHAAQARHRRALMSVALVALLFFLLLGGGLLWYTDRLHFLGRKTDQIATDLGKTQEDVAGLGENMRRLATDTADHFEKVEKEQEAQRAVQDKMMVKIDAAAQQVIAQEARIRGGLDQLKKDLGASLDDLNRRLTVKPNEKPAAANVPPPLAGGGQGGGVAANKAGPRIEPGMKMDVIMRHGTYYTGVLVGIEGTRVRLQTIPDPKAKPSEFDIKDVQAFQTRDGIFAYDEAAGRFETTITYYKFDKSSQVFQKSVDAQDAYLAEDAQVLGPVNAVKALLAVGRGGEWVLGLPIPASRSPGSMAAYQIKEIVTAKGLYSYDQSKGEYTYKAHSQLAAEAKAARDEYWKQVDEKQWSRRKEAYKLGTDRLRALSAYFWRRWW